MSDLYLLLLKGVKDVCKYPAFRGSRYVYPQGQQLQQVDENDEWCANGLYSQTTFSDWK